MIVTPLSVTTAWSLTVPSTLPPLAAAMSTITLPGFIEATMSAVMIRGVALLKKLGDTYRLPTTSDIHCA